MNEPVRSDEAARAAALDPERSILLQAPAGSGKTTVLTQRYLRLLAEVDEPEEILAITFTRKAAAEMREKVLDALAGKLPDHAETAAIAARLRDAALQHAARRGWDLQELPARLRIQTIDSLNHELARSMPLLGRAAGALDVIDQAGPLYQVAARQTLLDAEEDADFQTDMDLLFRRLDNNWGRAEQLLADMLQRRAQWLPPLLDGSESDLTAWVEESLGGIVRDALVEARRCIPAGLLDEGVQIARAVALHRAELAHEPGPWQLWLDPQTTAEGGPEALAAWAALASLAMTDKDEWRRRLSVREGIPPKQTALKKRCTNWIAALAESPHSQRCLATLRALPPPWLGDEGRAALTALARLLKLAASELKLQFQSAGNVDHTEIAAVARQALQSLEDPSDFALRQAAALRHLLVDEFQDTSIDQYGLLQALTVGWQAGDGRSLFLVGDPMQSIYQFRSAEVGLFLRARQQGIGDLPLESLQLTRNFRSVPAIVEWVNASFARVFPAADDLRTSAVSFHPSRAARAATLDPACGVTLRLLADDSRETEAQQVAATIVAARAREPRASIAILVLSRNHAPAILLALAQAGVATRGIDLAPLADQPAVGDLVSLARALLHAGDRSAWLSVLRAPWCGLTLDDLHRLAGGERQQQLLTDSLRDADLLAGLSPDGQARLRRCAGPLLVAYDNRAREDLATEVESLWLQLGGPAACTDARELALAREFLEQLRTLAARNERLDTERVQALAVYLKSGGAGEGGDAVDVLTIHKAKGLEWDIVIVPGMNRAARQGESPLLRWLELPRRDGGNDLLMAAMSIGNPEGVEPLGRYIAQLQKERAGNERARLAYVAATRARQQLHLFSYLAVADDADSPRPRSGSLLRTLWPAVGEGLSAQLAASGVATGTAVDRAVAAGPAVPRVFAPLVRLPATWQLPPPPTPILWDALDVGADEPPPRPEYSWVGLTARALGTVVHAELERLATQSGTAQALSARLPAWRAWLRQLGLPAGESDAAAARVLAVVERTLTDPRARWILDSAHRDARSELRLSGMVRGRLRNVIIDRCFVDADGSRWIIDFKTSGHEGGDLDSFLQQELDRYRPQLEQYAALAAQLGPEPVRAALYFPLLGEFREMPLRSLAAR